MKPTDQAGGNTYFYSSNDQVPAQQKQVPSTSATRSPHRPEADLDLDTNMDTDLTDHLDVKTLKKRGSYPTMNKTPPLPNQTKLTGFPDP